MKQFQNIIGIGYRNNEIEYIVIKIAERQYYSRNKQIIVSKICIKKKKKDMVITMGYNKRTANLHLHTMLSTAAITTDYEEYFFMTRKMAQLVNFDVVQ